MSASVISAKGWVVIPKALRERYGLKKGRKVYFVDYGGVISLIPALDDPIEQAMGMFKGGPSLTEELLRDRREELEHEEREFQKHD